jgi:site-specific DNA recombinase
MRVAFYGRVSTDDSQDPSLSIPRQLGKCEAVLDPIGEKIGVTFWDVESGRKALAERGNGKRDWTQEIAVPRAGGLPELLASATDGEIDAVIVESIDRLARMTADGTQIERELEERDVALFAADEPLNSSATAILTRRVKQGVAEWYVRDLMERSRAGMEESVRQGWHTGGPAPYGYMLEPHRHPNPQKAREGRHKHRLVIEPDRAPIVLMIFSWYCLRGLGLGAICEKLNRDLDRYPPPKRNRKDENDLIQTWSRSQLQAMLRNPKYTGYNVWNRHDKRKGRPLIRPRDQWIWSPEPTHEAIVPRDLFDQVEGRAHSNNNPIGGDAPKLRPYPAHSKPQGRRLYVLRGRVRCALCGRRMEGSHQKGNNWYRCQYVSKRGEAAAEISGHPKVLGIKEATILDAVREFMAERLFGPERLALLSGELLASTDGEAEAIEAQRERLEDEKSKIEDGLRRQTLRLEEHDDPEHPVVKLATARIEELSAQTQAIDLALTDLDRQQPEGPSPEQIKAMFADLPDLSDALATAEGDELIELLDAFDVTISYDKAGAALELTASVSADLFGEPETTAATGGESQGLYIAGAGFEPATFGL